MTRLTQTVRRTWKSAQLFIGFHQEKNGTRRTEPRVWPPKNASASIHRDPGEQEAFLVVKGVEGAKDVQVKLRPDKIVLRRDESEAWNGVMVTDDFVSVAVNGITIRINPEGLISREQGTDRTWVEPDGSVLKKTEFTEATMSSDGSEITRRTPENLAVINNSGMISRAR